ncbi:MAG: metal ABC transporter permease [Christensenellales bacterium]
MIEEIASMLRYGFVSRALAVGVLVSLCAALLGVILVLKRYSMIGDGLSHVGFGALSIAAVTGWAPLTVAMPTVIVAAILLIVLSDRGAIKGDAAIALMSTSALALGVILTSVMGVNFSVSNVMFGSILAMSDGDVLLSVAASITVLILFLIFYNRIFAVTFDETFARATGTKTGFYSTLIAVLTAITIVVGMRMMGTLLISSLVIFPALTSMRVFRKFRTVVLSSAVVSVVCFVTGLSASYLWSIPTGATVVMANLAAFLLFSLIGALAHRGGRA